jgi:hypothetical protein
MDQRKLLVPGPPLELALPRDHFGRTIEFFDVHQSGDFVFPGEPCEESLLVLEDASLQVAGRADVEHTRFAAHDVDVVAAAHVP